MISERLHLQQHRSEKIIQYFAFYYLSDSIKSKGAHILHGVIVTQFLQKKSFRQRRIYSADDTQNSVTLHLLPPSQNLPKPI
jgi:hypothetical protein